MLSYALFSFSVIYLHKITKNFIIDIIIHIPTYWRFPYDRFTHGRLCRDDHDLHYILLKINNAASKRILTQCMYIQIHRTVR